MKIGMIGFGNMGQAIYQKIKDDADELYINEKLNDKVNDFNLENTNLETKLFLDYIIVAVKPADIPLLKNIQWQGKIISIAAGVTLERLSSIFKGREIIRLMPNTPLLVGEGISGVFFDSKIDEKIQLEALEFIKSFTKVVVVAKESQMDAVTALSGSGPAFAYIFLEALSDAGVYCGLGRSESYQLAAQMLLGSSKMLNESSKHPGELKDMVTSPAGTTIEGVKALEKNAFRNAVMEGVIAAFNKAKNL